MCSEIVKRIIWIWKWWKVGIIHSIPSYGSQTTAAIERILVNARHTFGNSYGGQLATITERIFTYARHTVRNGHRGQTAAAIERTTADARHTVGNGHWGQATAAIERTTADAGHAVGNGHRGQAAATFESIRADARHIVSFTIFVSDCFWNNDISWVFIGIIWIGVATICYVYSRVGTTISVTIIYSNDTLI